MTRRASEGRTRGDIANVTLDNRLWVNWVRNGRRGGPPFTYSRFRKKLDEQDPKNPGSAPGEATIYRLATIPLPKLLAPRAKYDDIAGLGDLAINTLFSTPLARKAMRMEWRLRSASYNKLSPAEALLLLPEAEGILEDMDEEAKSGEECPTQLLTRASLAAQIATYKAGAPGTRSARKVRLFREAQQRLAKCAEVRMQILRSLESAFTDCVLAVRMETLAYFAEYNLRNEPRSDLLAMARRISQDSVLKKVKDVTEKLGDPRNPINFAEAAGYVAMNEGGGKADSYNKKAREMVELTLNTAGWTGPVHTFTADWLPAGYDLLKAEELQAAIRLIAASKKEK